jgi:hypothetical protein
MLKKLIKELIIKIPKIKQLVQENNVLRKEVERLVKKNNALKEEREQLLTRRKVEYYEYLVYLYKYLLDREVGEPELKSNQYSLQSPSELLTKFIESEEYKIQLQQKEAERREYIICLYKYLLKREPVEADVTYHLRSLDNSLKIFKTFIESQEYQEKQESFNLDLSFLGAAYYIIGESKPISANTVFQWYRTAAELLIEQNNKTKFLQIGLNNQSLIIHEKKDFFLTIITSLYKGEKYLQTFLENIISQTVFSECQLFIIDANSPESEREIAQPYLEAYSNIKYLRLAEKINIYEAWNLAIKESKSEFITNANVDDLQRNDAFELKIQALRDNLEIDVVYSDVYYSFLANMPFEIVEKCGIKTNLPTVNKYNLLAINSPHNSPMWRRTLHDKIGYFETNYKSAADYEFWLRAVLAGSAFLKIPEPVVVYYQNPQGMSSKENTPSLVEVPQIVAKYRSLLQEL